MDVYQTKGIIQMMNYFKMQINVIINVYLANQQLIIVYRNFSFNFLLKIIKIIKIFFKDVRMILIDYKHPIVFVKMEHLIMVLLFVKIVIFHA